MFYRRRIYSKAFKVTEEGIFLIPENPKYEPIKVNEENHFQIWGIVTHVIKSIKP